MENHLPQGNSGGKTWCLARKDAGLGSLKHIKVNLGFNSALQPKKGVDAGLLEQW